MKKNVPIVFLAAGALLLPGLASAEMAVHKGGVALVPPAANTGAVAPSEQASTVREPKKTGGTLRCWQHGRLIYEGAGFRTDVERQPNAVTMPKADGDAVVVYDQKDSVCILTKK